MASLEHDRGVHWLMAANSTLDADGALARLENACLSVSVDETVGEAWAQAALMTFAVLGRRMFRCGVYFTLPDTRTTLAVLPRTALARLIVSLGGRLEPAPAHAVRLHVGPSAPEKTYSCWTDGWTAAAGPTGPGMAAAAGNAVSGALTAAMAIEELFRRAVLDDPLAGRQQIQISAWGPDAPPTGKIDLLPADLWFLGLGNLGQAALWVTGLLPYRDPGAVRLWLQDFDTAGPENLQVQVLTEPSWIGRRKTRCAAAWAEDRGFMTTLTERAFTAETQPGREEPRLLIAGVDNLPTRRLAAVAGFDLVIDGGLGASAADAFDLRLHAFPGRRSADQAWPETQAGEPVLSEGLKRAVAEGRIDTCGAMMLAGKSVGVPCTAMAAAALQMGQVIRTLQTGRCCDLIDLRLPRPDMAMLKVMDEPLARLPAFLDAAVD